MKTFKWAERVFWALVVLMCYAALGAYAAEHQMTGALKQLSNPLHCSLWQVVAGAVFPLPLAIISLARSGKARPVTAGGLVLIAVAIGCALGAIGARLSLEVWLWISAAVGCGVGSVLLYAVWFRTKTRLVRLGLAVGFLALAIGGAVTGWVLGDNSDVRWQVEMHRKDNVVEIVPIAESPYVLVILRMGEPRVYNYMTGEPASAQELAKAISVHHGLATPFGSARVSMNVPMSGARAVARSADGTRLAIGSHKGKIVIWDVPGKRRLTVLQLPHDPPQPVYSLAFTPDRNRLMSNYYEDEAVIWDLDSGRIVRKLHGHSGGAWVVTISPDGKHILTADSHGVIRLWALN